MIYNSNGTPYEVSGCYQLFNDRNPDRRLLSSWDAESIRMGGSPLYYYEYFVDLNTIDPIYLESRNGLYSQTPVTLYCFYDNIPSQNYQNQFGIDSPDEMIFNLNYQDVLDRLGYVPKINSRLNSPFLNENWVIIERKLSNFEMWQATRLQLICGRFQPDTVSGNDIAAGPILPYNTVATPQ
jgi:hypothetical protein